MALIRTKIWAGTLIGLAAATPGCRSVETNIAENCDCASRNHAIAIRLPAPTSQSTEAPAASAPVALASHQQQVIATFPAQSMPVCSPDDPFVSQETLPLDRLIDEVLARNPSLAALTAMWQAAVQRYPQVISLDDPVLTTMLGPGAIGNDEIDGAYMVGFSQKLPWPGKKRLQGSAARWEAAASGFEVGDLQLQLVEGTKQAYVDYYVAAREMELNVENVNIMREFREAADARYRTNQVTQQDVLQADVELAQLERQRFELERMQLVAVARINTLLHRAADYPLPPPPSRLEAELELPPAAALQAVALERRPDLAAVDARIRAEQASLALMHREFYPDLEIMARYDAFWQEDPLRPMVGLNVDLPIRRDRRWAAVREAGFRLSQRQAEFAQQLDTINNEVYSGYARLEESRRALLLYQERLLPTAQRNVESARAGYVAGSLDFLRLVDAQRQLITLQEQRYETEAEFHRRAAELERVIGGPIPFVPVVIEEIPAPPPG